MTDRTYFLATGESEAKVRAFFEQRRLANAEANALAKEVGGKGAAVGRTMVGVIFAGSAPEGWTSRGYASDGAPYYAPLRKSKGGKDLCKRMAEIRMPDAATLHSQFSAAGGTLQSVGQGIAIAWISAEIITGKAIISVPAGMDFVPPECTPLKMSEYWAIKESAAA